MRHQVHRRLKSTFWLITSFLHRPHTMLRNADGSMVTSGFPTPHPPWEHNDNTASGHRLKVLSGISCQDLSMEETRPILLPLNEKSLCKHLLGTENLLDLSGSARLVLLLPSTRTPCPETCPLSKEDLKTLD